jgi:hypothetical protein
MLTFGAYHMLYVLAVTRCLGPNWLPDPNPWLKIVITFIFRIFLAKLPCCKKMVQIFTKGKIGNKNIIRIRNATLANM